MTIILHSKFLFVAPLLRPYVQIRDQDVFVEPLGYLGIFTLPLLKKEWPQTAGIEDEELEPLEVLKKSSSWE